MNEDQPTPPGPNTHKPASPHARFHEVVLANLDAAHNLAWWLTRHAHDSADIVQESCLKAWRSFDTLRGGDGRSWFLAIVRNTAISRLRGRAPAEGDAPDSPRPDEPLPLERLVSDSDRLLLEASIASLPAAHREILILRELEGLSYAQIAAVVGIPEGTVMSRLSRARDALYAALSAKLKKE